MQQVHGNQVATGEHDVILLSVFHLTSPLLASYLLVSKHDIGVENKGILC
jgi:hypothetical protein